MEIIFLGTASCYPSPHRGASSTVLRLPDGQCWMYDCGEATQVQVMKSSVKPGKISKIFISHLHGDHLFGLPGLLCTMGQNCAKRSEPLEIYGPVGLRKYVRINLELSRSVLGFTYAVHELEVKDHQQPHDWTTWHPDHQDLGPPLHPNEAEGSLIQQDASGVCHLCEDERFTVRAATLDHRIASFGFVMQEKPLPGKLDAELLKKKGVAPGPLYSQLKAGHTITTHQGVTVKPSQAVGPPRPGRKIVILGDTCDSAKMAPLAQNADVLVHEATLSNELGQQALQNGHSTPEMAGQFAAKVNARKLVITHFSQRYLPFSENLKEGEEDTRRLEQQAKAAYGSQEVIAAEDFTVVPVPLRPLGISQ